MSDRKPTSVVLPAVVAVLVLLPLYVGAYYAMVWPMHFELTDAHGEGIVVERVHAIYPTLPRCGESLFAPIHWLDRRIRPHVWEPTP